MIKSITTIWHIQTDTAAPHKRRVKNAGRKNRREKCGNRLVLLLSPRWFFCLLQYSYVGKGKDFHVKSSSSSPTAWSSGASPAWNWSFGSWCSGCSWCGEEGVTGVSKESAGATGVAVASENVVDGAETTGFGGSGWALGATLGSSSTSGAFKERASRAYCAEKEKGRVLLNAIEKLDFIRTKNSTSLKSTRTTIGHSLEDISNFTWRRLSRKAWRKTSFELRQLDFESPKWEVRRSTPAAHNCA